MKKTAPRFSPVLLAATLVLASPMHARAAVDSSDPLAKTLDAMLTGLYAKDAPGAAVIAVRDGRTVLRNAYGMADLELGVPLQPDMVFRIGSMTKQFTASSSPGKSTSTTTRATSSSARSSRRRAGWGTRRS